MDDGEAAADPGACGAGDKAFHIGTTAKKQHMNNPTVGITTHFDHAKPRFPLLLAWRGSMLDRVSATADDLCNCFKLLEDLCFVIYV